MSPAPASPTIDPARFPMPKDAPALGECVRLEWLEEDRVVRLVLDPPHRKQTVFDAPLLRDLDLAFGEVEKRQDLVGLILTGRKPLHFCYGADIDSFEQLESAVQATELARAGQLVFQRLHKLGKSGGGSLNTVAAVGGPVPGGACEVSLACDTIVFADDPSSRIGLPEVKLGILPGWGGCQRLPRRVGVPAALDAILNGKLYDPRRAKKMGFVDRVTPPVYLERIALDLASGREKPRRKERGSAAWAVDKNPLALEIIATKARKTVIAATGGHYPAPLRALELVVAAPRTDLEEGLLNEAEALGALAVSKESRSLVGIFQSSEQAKKLGTDKSGKKAEGFRRAAVVGAGVMGGGIASLLATKGHSTRLADLSRAQLDDAVREHQDGIGKRRKRRRMAGNDADAALDRLEVSQTSEGFGGCDFVIEAVSEVMGVKHKVLGHYAALAKDDAVIATNTSSLSVDEIANGVSNPERVVGMHFFNPVAKMPLVEVVRGKRTDEAALRRVAQLALKLGKTPVIVSDAAGFVVNRLLGPYLDECVRLYEAGCAPAELDRLAKSFGMPMGPFVLLDQVGLDIAAHTATSLHEGFGDRMEPSSCLAPLVEAGELGKKSGAGVFLYGKRAASQDSLLTKWGKKFGFGKDEGPPLNSRLRRPAGAPPISPLPEEEKVDRMILPMVNEAARALEEGVTATAAELDLATVFGMGFAPFRGGVLAYADHLGAREVLRRLQRCLRHPDVAERGASAERFEPAPLLLKMADEGKRFR